MTIMRPFPPPPQGLGYEETDIATVLEIRAMLVMSRDDPGMRDLLSRAKEYYALKGSPSLNDAIKNSSAKKEKRPWQIEE